MNRSERKTKVYDDEIVKCGCGLPMRLREWRDHWRTCRVGSPVQVSERDKSDLLAYEDRRRKADAEHKAWMQSDILKRLSTKNGTLTAG